NSFTLAAEKLYLTQSTVSSHIQSMEQALGVSLLIRGTRRQIHLTAEGERIYPAAKRILADCQNLKDLVQNEQADMPLSLGASTVPAQYILPFLLAEFLKYHPNSRYLLNRGDSAQIHELVKTGDIQVGFVGTMLEPETLNYISLAEDKLVLVTENSKRFQELQRQGIWGRMLLGEPTVAREEGSGTDRSVRNYMHQIGFPTEKLQIIARIDNIEAIKSMVARGVGVSVLSALAVQDEVAAGQLLQFEMEQGGLKRSIYMIYRRDISNFRLGQQFVQFVRKRSSFNQKSNLPNFP
ncbi:MAG: selenium metabolism-associated LysR family transcriptional regulator, partial [Oscillospiraceae bacterium]